MRVLVIDLDETLVSSNDEIKIQQFVEQGQLNNYCKEGRQRAYHFTLSERDGKPDITIHGTLRKHAREFVRWADRNFDYVVVWSAGQRDYVYEIVSIVWNGLPQPDLVMTYDDLDFSRKYPCKPLNKVCEMLQVDLGDVIILDDNPRIAVDNPDNLLLIPTYRPPVWTCSDDDMLDEVQNFLTREWNEDGIDVRSLGLRNALTNGKRQGLADKKRNLDQALQR